MKTLSKFARKFLPITIMVAMAGCSTLRGDKTSGEEIGMTGPKVISAKTTPGTIELDGTLRPTQPVEIVADVKDFTANVVDVKVRFLHAPLEIPMQHIGGTTWSARLTPEQLRLLAVSGQTITYDANVIARNADGKVAVSREPVKVAVSAPELSPPVG